MTGIIIVLHKNKHYVMYGNVERAILYTFSLITLNKV
jgi:hypothetical protein